MFDCFIVYYLPAFASCSSLEPEYSNGVGEHCSQNSSYDDSLNISADHVYTYQDFETDESYTNGDELV